MLFIGQRVFNKLLSFFRAKSIKCLESLPDSNATISILFQYVSICELLPI